MRWRNWISLRFYFLFSVWNSLKMMVVITCLWNINTIDKRSDCIRRRQRNTETYFGLPQRCENQNNCKRQEINTRNDLAKEFQSHGIFFLWQKSNPYITSISRLSSSRSFHFSLRRNNSTAQGVRWWGLSSKGNKKKSFLSPTFCLH